MNAQLLCIKQSPTKLKNKGYKKWFLSLVKIERAWNCLRQELSANYLIETLKKLKELIMTTSVECEMLRENTHSAWQRSQLDGSFQQTYVKGDEAA